MLGKPKTGTIVLGASKEGQILKLSISDDGKGVDPKEVRRIAFQKRILDERSAQSMTEQDWVQFIFTPGFSTKLEVSDLSGRGVGLDSVKTSVEEKGGKVEIHTQVNQGTTFILTIPEVV